MTYCLAAKVNRGLVFASDSRTSAGVDDVRTYGKMHVFEFPGEALFVLLTAGNLATTQAVVAQLNRDLRNPEAAFSLRGAASLFDAAEYIGRVSVRAQKAAAAEAEQSAASLEATFILGGQVRGEEPGLYMIYPIGNCIATSPETPFLQIGESKYGKPILDRIIRPELSLEDAARCALVSLDSTMRSNISVGPPLELLIYRRDELRAGTRMRMDFDTPYYRLLKDIWGRELEAIFHKLPRFDWEVNEGKLTQPVPAAGVQLTGPAR
jgi:putative proteasome-type protease